MNKIKNKTYTILSDAWATLKQIEFDYQFSSGEWKRLKRESYNRGNGAAILLYNSETKNVILTKQFRMPAYENDQNDGMSIEVCAGAIDNNDSPLETVLREAKEEVGYELKDAKYVLSAYMSPGAVTEKLHLFIADYKNEAKVSKGGGIISEDEDTEVMELSFEEAISMMNSGRIIDAKTVMLLQYAQINRLID